MKVLTYTTKKVRRKAMMRRAMISTRRRVMKGESLINRPACATKLVRRFKSHFGQSSWFRKRGGQKPPPP